MQNKIKSHLLVGALSLTVGAGVTHSIHTVGDEPAKCIAIEGENYSICPTSFWRSEYHNQEVGGASHSNHLDGCAFDFVTDPPGYIKDFHDWVTNLKEEHSELNAIFWVEPYQDTHTHVHIDWRCHERK